MTSELDEIRLQNAEAALADLKAKYDMLKEHCDDREQYIIELEQAIIRAALRRED